MIMASAAQGGTIDIQPVDFSDLDARMDRITELISSGADSIPSNALMGVDELAHLISCEEEDQVKLSSCIQDISTEITSLNREIEFRSIQIIQLREKIDSVKSIPATACSVPMESEYMNQLDHLYVEYSKVWRNIAFVEHHLKVLDDKILCRGQGAPMVVTHPITY